MNAEEARWYPAANPERQPTPWWYFGRAVYVSRRDYGRIFLVFIAIGAILAASSILFLAPMFLWAAVTLAGVGVAMLIFSLLGLYRMYGHPATRYLRDLLALGGVEGRVVVADLHIGTYRH